MSRRLGPRAFLMLLLALRRRHRPNFGPVVRMELELFDDQRALEMWRFVFVFSSLICLG
jgi:hypothetical protein